jgi:hypothetical protein
MPKLIAESRGTSITDVKDLIRLTCINLKNNRYYIGVKQELVIKAPIKTVSGILEDIDHYKELFPGYKDVHVVKREDDKLLTFWEQIVPVPFVSNIKYQMIYKMGWLSSTERLFRYQLVAPTELLSSDGFILLKANSPTETSYLEYDFFDAKWGAAKFMGMRKIWYDSVEGLALSDIATKFQAENAKWSHERSLSEARKSKYQDNVVSCITRVIN